MSPRLWFSVKRRSGILLGIGLCLLFLGLASLLLDRYTIYIISLIGIFIVATASLNLTNGYVGLFSLGHAGFMAIGAYISALLTFPAALRSAYKLPHLPPLLGGAAFEWPYLPAVVVGGLVAAGVSVLLGYPALRLRGHYLSLATLGLVVILETVFTNAREITRGPIGINGIPSYTNLWWVYAWVAVTLYVVWRVVNSSYGRAMMSIREDELVASTLGINTTKYRVFSFTLGAFFAGVAGGLFGHLTTAIAPYDFSFGMTFDIVIMLVVGGLGSITGSVLGASVIVALGFALKPIEEGMGIYGLVEVIYAVLLIVVMIKRPTGLAGGKELSPSTLIQSLSSIILGKPKS